MAFAWMGDGGDGGTGGLTPPAYKKKRRQSMMTKPPFK